VLSATEYGTGAASPSGQEVAMPLNRKGSKVMRAMQGTYGAEQGKRVFYASKNSGRIKGVERKRRKSSRSR
jgi:hypothetical protein